jgi:hypothetical protein
MASIAVRDVLKDALEFAHRYVLEGTMEGVDDELANRRQDGTANSIGSTYAHVVLSEDHIVNRMIRGETPLSEDSWAGRTGVDRPMPWSSVDALRDWYGSVQVDVNLCRQYAAAVHESVLRFISDADGEELGREIEIFGMSMPVATAFEIFVIGHANSIGGELSALKGVAGLKGYPF